MRKKEPPKLDASLRRNRQLGALWGLAIGDALGVTQQDRRLLAPLHPEIVDGRQTSMRGGGPQDLRPGQVSPVTQGATVAAMVLKNEHEYKLEVAFRAYRQWAEECPPSDAHLKPLFDAYAEGGMRPLVALRHWVMNRKTAENHAAMARVVPLAAFFSTEANKRISASLEDCALTHFSPLCLLSSICVGASLAHAIEALEPLPPEKLLSKTKSEVRKAAVDWSAQYPEHSIATQAAVEQVFQDLDFAGRDDPEIYGPDIHIHATAGSARLTTRLAFWHLLHESSVEEALIDVINRGGASATHAAVTGALLGALAGADAFPEEWKDTVWNAPPMVNPKGPPLKKYHPRQLLALFMEEET